MSVEAGQQPQAAGKTRIGRVARPAKGHVGLAMMGLVALLAACDREVILPGQRFDTRTPLEATLDPENGLGDATVETVAAPPPDRVAVPIRLAEPRTLTSWSHRNTGTDHVAPHLALGTTLTPVWTAAIGKGDSRRHRITATPVAANGLIYTMDSRALVSAHRLSTGETVWTRDLTPPQDRADDASGGGLALGDGTLYVTSGFGTATALDAATGAVRWTQSLGAAATSAPTVDGPRVYVVSNDAVAHAIDTKTGQVEWTLVGAPNVTGLVGAASPALSGRNVILPLGSGELITVLRQTGLRVWGTSVTGERNGRAYSIFNDVTGDPVVSGGRVYVGNPQGKLIAVEAASGERIWTAGEGAYGPVVPAGGSLFFVSDQARLIRIDASTGETIWAEQMPYFESDRPRRLRAVYAHHGPILAGGRLLVGSSDGVLRSFDPASGAPLASVEIPGGAATAPIVVGGVAYVVSTRGVLHAYR